MVGELRASHVIHLHRLLSAVRAEFHEHGLEDDDLGEYREYDVTPADFKATKSEHERALLALSAALSEWAADQLETGREHDGDRDRRQEAGAPR